MRYRQVWPIDVHLRPFYLAGIMKATKNPGAPMMLDRKQAHMELDIRRNAKYWDIPISLPKVKGSHMNVNIWENRPTGRSIQRVLNNDAAHIEYIVIRVPRDLFEDFKTIAFTKTSALAQRLLLAIQKQHPSSVVEHCAGLMWRRFFTEHKSIFDEEDLRQVLKRLPDCNEDTLLKVAVTEEVKTALRTNTDEALAHGCFGAPWIHVRRSAHEIEPFFGSDRLPLIGHLIGQEFQGPLIQYASHEQNQTAAG
ncbi:unnamed protein product [Haemonchus placei]|uniref:Glutathione S-transferase kappa n=1 Tax=Haemonchus placei TaxID=6290 RepID=A0A0N4X843_HAEPC|nr:unnamed protein product [Haemonchus placei]